MNKKPHQLRHPQSFINGLERTDKFLEELQGGEERKIAIGRAAAFHHERMSQTESLTPEARLDRFAVRLIATLPAFIEARHALDEMEEQERETGRKVDRRKRIPYIKDSIPYNHALRDLIDEFPDLTPENIVRFSEIAMLDIGNADEARYSREHTRRHLHGMQHEIGLEQIAWQIDEVEDVRHATEEEELNGIDLVITYNGIELPVDAKASEVGEKKALFEREKYLASHNLTESKYGRGYPIWTHIEHEDFGGGFRISDERAATLAPRVKATLDQFLALRRLAA